MNRKIIKAEGHKRGICNEEKAAGKQTWSIISHEMQFINNKALYLNMVIPLSVISFANIFSYSVGCLFIC